ncbi:MAG: c-type cytochrome [Deltaproteobacteria bacterium]|jgi:mono/diheme cytochrome c family protein|nr:c-type cytochrome [Deltaproteobacteria bacterium]
MSKLTNVECLVAIGLIIGFTGIACTSVSGRDDVTEEVKSRQKPVTLEESEIRYYERQFKGKCSRCHGIDGTGKGSDAEASDQIVKPANFTDAKYMASRTDGQLFYQILKGGGDRCAMPAFGPGSDHAWTEDKIWHMVAFVRRFAQASSQ